MNILVVGGAGYIGSHMVKALVRSGFKVTVLDDLSSGFLKSIPANVLFVKGSVSDSALLLELFKSSNFDAVFHFASSIQVGESIINPSKYYNNNVVSTLVLLDAMVASNVKKFIFSSTAAIFGNPLYLPIDEAHAKDPINPYGRSKLIVEQILDDYDKAYSLKSVSLRYFNAAGADPDGELGECHDPETHLIPLILQVASGRRNEISVFGSDYNTPDGTCIRDYIHVNDLCSAHLLSLQYLMSNNRSDSFNLGNGLGFSVLDVINSVKEVTRANIPIRFLPRRTGDPARLIADSGRIKEKLNWSPKFFDLNTIVQHAWSWEKKIML